MYSKRIVSYSLLAHINDSSEGIRDLTDIFIPLLKRILSELDKIGKRHGNIEVVRDMVLGEYGLKIPMPLIRKILIKIARDINGVETTRFVVNKDGSYLIENFIFREFEDSIKDNQFEIDTLTNAYEIYLKDLNISVSTQPCIFEFIDKNRKELINYIDDSSERITIDTSFKIQADFIEKIKMDRNLFKTLRKVYLGSIISCYIEVECFEIKDSCIEFLLDTTFLLGLLDLRTQEDTDTCMMILELCAKLGHKMIILDSTLDETENLLRSRAERNGNLTFGVEQDPIFDSIYFACLRKNLKKTDLQKLANGLKPIIFNIFNEKGVKYREIRITENEQMRVERGELHKVLKTRPNNKKGALHDAISIDWIRNERTRKGLNNKKQFFDIGFWLITSDTTSVPMVVNRNYSPEAIKPEHLVNILWLSSPVVSSDVLKSAGLTRLISNTLDTSLVKPKVFSELKDNFKKYESEGVTEDDLMYLTYGLANSTLTTLDIQDLNDEANKGNFINTLHEKTRKVKMDDEIEKKKQVEMEIEKESLERLYHEELNRNKESYNQEITLRVRQEQIKHISSVIDMLIVINETQSQTAAAIIIKDTDLTNKLSKQAKTEVSVIALIIYSILGIFIYFISSYIIKNWIHIEPITYVIGIMITYFGVGLLVCLGVKFDIIKARETIIKLRENNLNKKFNINNNGIIEEQTNMDNITKNIEILHFIKSQLNDTPEDFEDFFTDLQNKNSNYKQLIDSIRTKI